MSKSTNPLTRIVDSGTYGILTARLALTKIFRHLTNQVVGTKETELHSRMDLWITRTYKSTLPRERSSLKGNTANALAADKMTWGTFAKGVDILGFPSLYIKMIFLKKNAELNGVYTNNKLYKAIVAGDEFDKKDIILHSQTFNFADHSLLYELWYNKTAQKFIKIESTKAFKEINEFNEADAYIPDITAEYSKDQID
jgi:hypothetical protein